MDKQNDLRADLTGITKAVSIKQPWTWAIIEGYKLIENRSWTPNKDIVGKEVAIHASLKDDKGASGFITNQSGVTVPDSLPHGAIVGTVIIRGWIDEDNNQFIQDNYLEQWHEDYSFWLEQIVDWYFGPIGWILSDTKKLTEPVPCKGALGFWNIPTDILYGNVTNSLQLA